MCYADVMTKRSKRGATQATALFSTSFHAWMREATTEQQDALAAAIGSSRGTLYQYAQKHRGMSAARAAQIEAALSLMPLAPALRLLRTDLCEACAQCPYAEKVLGPRAVVSAFPVAVVPHGNSRVAKAASTDGAHSADSEGGEHD